MKPYILILAFCFAACSESVVNAPPLDISGTWSGKSDSVILDLLISDGSGVLSGTANYGPIGQILEYQISGTKKNGQVSVTLSRKNLSLRFVGSITDKRTIDGTIANDKIRLIRQEAI